MREIMSGAVERYERSTTPHHDTPLGAAHIMAVPKSSTPPVHSRSENGTPLYRRVCAECGTVSFVDKRRVGKLCHPCANRARQTHGLCADGSMHPLYRLLKNMEARCRYPSASHYEYYGGRGISVCREWLEDPHLFVGWAEANGWKPGMEIDRIDVDGNYCPENCRFVTHRQNSQLTRRISTTPEQALRARELLRDGATVKTAARGAGVSYMVAWHIKNSSSVWRTDDDA